MNRLLLLARRLPSSSRRLLETASSSSSPSPPSVPQSSPFRPDLDFDYLLDDANTEKIRQNIVSRKGVGDIDAVRSKWTEIQSVINAKEAPSISEKEYEEKWNELYELAALIPNESDPKSPIGGEENAQMISEWGEKREEDPLLPAEKLVQSWRSLLHPLEAAGQRSYTLLGSLANMEKALLDYAFERSCVLGFKPVTVPDLVDRDVTRACGVVDRSNQHIQYVLLNEPSTVLSGTAEMGIAALLRGRTFEREQLPVRLVAMSRCFRPEISKSASESKLYRVHEFTKVEMFTLCEPDQSEGELEHLVQIQKGTFESLGIHCRQLEMPTEELGAAARRKVDVEAWMPGRKMYGEVSSASNCGDYQSRRLGIKYKTASGESAYVHTCNGTAIASTRALISLLETFQTEKKGLLELPEVISRRLKVQRSPPLRMKPAASLA